MSFPIVEPHDPIQRIDDSLFVARGSVKLNPILRLTRNMTIVKQADDLTLINPVRLNDSELARLDELGTVKHLMRLGPFHGQDDPFYIDRYGAEFWCQEGGTTYTEPKIDHALTESSDLPFSGAKLFCFEGTKEPESVLWLESGEGTLLSCDAIQHYDDYSNCNLPARLLMPWIGFPRTTLIGPFWMKLMTAPDASLKSEFARLLELVKFERFLGAHGTFVARGAWSAVRKAVATAYPD